MLSNSELSVRVARPAHPFVEVAEDDLRACGAPVVHERGETWCLVAPLEDGRAEMDVVDVQRAARADLEVDALAGSRLARAPREVGTGYGA